MIFSKKSHEGYLFVDHRASPGLPEEMARMAGYDPVQCREGKMYESATLGCPHCGVCVVKNPFRTRERASCEKCNYAYICDGCAFAMRDPNYVHRTRSDIHDLLNTGKWALSGTVSNPNLTPISGGN